VSISLVLITLVLMVHLFQAKHVHPEVQKSGIRCLGLFAHLTTKPTSSVVRQLRLSIQSGIPIVQNMSIKALFDLILCHGATNLDRAIDIGPDLGPVPEPCPFGTQVLFYSLQHQQACTYRTNYVLRISFLTSGFISYTDSRRKCGMWC
jgi:hypothetical protein